MSSLLARLRRWLSDPLIEELRQQVNGYEVRRIAEQCDFQRLLAAADERYLRMDAKFAEHLLQERQGAAARQAQQRVDLEARIRDKDAYIQDLKLQLAMALTDAEREKQAKVSRETRRVVPEFGGPMSWQDELHEMKADEYSQDTKEKSDEVSRGDRSTADAGDGAGGAAGEG